MTSGRTPIRRPAPMLDDFNIGDVHASYARTVTETHLVNFAALAGLQLPLFIDHEHARSAGMFGSPIVPGFLTASLSGGMLESVLGHNVLAGLGMQDFVFTKPVCPGDTLHAEVEVKDKEVAGGHGRGVLSVGVNVVNQRNEVVLSYSTQVLMKKEG